MAKKLKFDPNKIKKNATTVPTQPVMPVLVSDVSSSSRDAVEIPLDIIDPYTDPNGASQPFQMYGEEQMVQMVESIKEQGVLVPVILRPLNGRYQTIAGHNRIEAARQAGLTTVPAVVRPYDDDAAAIAVVDTNLQQRQTLLPSERAKAYKLKMDALKHKSGERSDLNETETVDTAQDIANESNTSRNSVFRYLRLNELSDELMQKVDAGIIPVAAASDHLTKLSEPQQRDLGQRMTAANTKKLTPAQCEDIRTYAERGQFEEVAKIVEGKKEKALTLTVKVEVDDLLTAEELKAFKKELAKLKDDKEFADKLVEFLRTETGGQK